MLKNVETGSLAIALKTAVPTLQNMVFQNMSSRAATILREDMEVLSPKAEDVEVAVGQILNEAKTLIRNGEMVLQPTKE
jgi:flagellar motor switch protein FliG